jgi:hypothetical protein
VTSPQEPVPPSTQECHPLRATFRTAFQVVVGLASAVPYIFAEADIPATGVGAQVVAVSMAITRIMAIPQVNALLRQHLPWLATDDHSPK